MRSAGRDRKALADIFSRYDYVQAALVFGSVAKGQARDDSDLDVAVVSPSPLTVARTIELIEALADHFACPIDLIDLARVHGAVARIAFTEGILVYCQDARAYRERLRRMVYDQADWMPILRSANSRAINRWLTQTSSRPK